MATDIAKELAALQRMSAAVLREKYAEVFGEATTTGNRTWLQRRIAWRIRANAEGNPSERAKARTAELARAADLRITAPREKPTVLPLMRGGHARALCPRRSTTPGSHHRVRCSPASTRATPSR
jgi:hypothetical protein